MKTYLAIKFTNGKTAMSECPNHYSWSLPLRLYMLVFMILMVLMGALL